MKTSNPRRTWPIAETEAWLDLSDVRYGKSGYDHRFDFVIPKSRAQPERLLRTLNRPNRDTAQSVAFSWIDTRATRAPESRAYAILNDADRAVPEPVLDAIRSSDVRPVPWSGREAAREDPAA